MKRLLALASVVAVLLLAAFPRAAQSPLSAAGTAALNTFLSGQVSRGVIPGVVTVVVSRDAVLYSGAFGLRNSAKNAPLTADSIFRIASMTKAVTSVATMMMVEQGKLKLDDEVSTYLPATKRSSASAPRTTTVWSRSNRAAPDPSSRSSTSGRATDRQPLSLSPRAHPSRRGGAANASVVSRIAGAAAGKPVFVSQPSAARVSTLVRESLPPAMTRWRTIRNKPAGP